MDKMIKKVFILCSIIFLFCNFQCFAQDKINEDELFSTPESIFETEKIIYITFLEEEKKTLGISGKATSVMEYTDRRTDSINQKVIND